jgi:hypothetical protein
MSKICRYLLAVGIAGLLGCLTISNLQQEQEEREKKIEELKQSILSKVLSENGRYIRSLKGANIWTTLGVPIDGMSAGSDPFDESGYEPPGGLFDCGDLKILSRKFGFPNKLKVIRTNGTTENDWTLNCFNLWIKVARDEETNELIFYENGKPKWFYEVKSPCGTLSKKLEIHNLELNCEKDDFETIAKIRALTDLCNIISGHTEFPTESFGNNLKCGYNSDDSDDDDSDDDDDSSDDDDEQDEPVEDIDEKAELFLLEIFEGKSEEITELRKFYSDTNHVPTSCLELVGLEGFVKSKNPTTIPTQWTSKKDYVFTGNPKTTWTIFNNTISFVKTETGGQWECLFLSFFESVRSGSIEVLRTGLAPEDHFRVYAFIKLLNIIRSEPLDQ